MTIEASVGTCIAVSAALPATFNSAGYAALTYTTVGELESIGDLLLKKAAVTFSNLCTGKTSTLKGIEEALTIQIGVALDRDDAGQDIMRAAYASINDYSFQVSEANGDKIYFTGKVMSDGVKYGGVNDIKKANYDIGVTTRAGSDTLLVVEAI